MRYLKSQNSLVTRCKSCSRQEITRYSLQNLLVVVEVARCKKSLVTRCKIRPLLAVEVARCKNALVVKIHSLLVQNSTVIYCINSPRKVSYENHWGIPANKFIFINTAGL